MLGPPLNVSLNQLQVFYNIIYVFTPLWALDAKDTDYQDTKELD